MLRMPPSEPVDRVASAPTFQASPVQDLHGQVAPHRSATTKGKQMTKQWTPADLTEGCLVTGTYYGRPSFNDDPVRRDNGGWYMTDTDGWRIYIGSSTLGRWNLHVTVTDIKPAPKPAPLWADPAIPDDAWIAWEWEDGSQVVRQVASQRSIYPIDDKQSSFDGSNVRRVWLIDKTQVAVKREWLDALAGAAGRRSAADRIHAFIDHVANGV